MATDAKKGSPDFFLPGADIKLASHSPGQLGGSLTQQLSGVGSPQDCFPEHGYIYE